MVYLCRKGKGNRKSWIWFESCIVLLSESGSEGFIKWKFSVDAETKKVFDTVSVNLDYTTYENGEVKAFIGTDQNKEVSVSLSKLETCNIRLCI